MDIERRLCTAEFPLTKKKKKNRRTEKIYWDEQ